MHPNTTTRPGTSLIETPAGAVLVDHTVPGILRATAGGPGGPPGLALDGRTIAVDLAFAHQPSSGRYSLVAEGARIVWDALDPGTRLPDATWMAAAHGVMDAVEAHLAEHPEIGRVASYAAIRSRLSEIDEDLAAAGDLVERLRAERASLAGKVAPLRLALLSGVA